jgi:hypothetical protein
MKIGDRVHCTAYVERTGQGISVLDLTSFERIDNDLPSEKMVCYCENSKVVTIPFHEFTDATIDKFKTIAKEFDGIYVGTTRLATKLTATYETPVCGNDFIVFESECFEKFAVVYYANNRKRLVPVDCVKGGKE